VTAELLEVKSDRKVRTLRGHNENANLAAFGHGHRGQREVFPKGAAKGVSRLGTV
jgi:hypothetical protein